MGDAPRRRLIFDHDIRVFDSLAVEEVHLYGASLKYYSLASRNRDPIYQEQILEVFYSNPVELYANVEWMRQDADPEASELGSRLVSDAEIRVPRVLFERAGVVPKVGDVVEMFVEADQPVLFDVVTANQGEAVYNSKKFVWYRMKGKRRSESLPEIRIEGEN